MSLNFVQISVRTNVELELNICILTTHGRSVGMAVGTTLYSHFGSFCIVYWKICALTAINLRYITDDYSEKGIF